MIVEPQHFAWLKLQRGGISELAHDFDAWKQAYESTLEADFQSILPVLPAAAHTMLDVGGGMSGISAKVNAHYDGRLRVAVLDGKNCQPEVKKHRQPYNNATMTCQFLAKNGVRDVRFFEPGDAPKELFNIVISTQAWGFHIAPEEYLSRVEDCVLRGSVVILDVRKHHNDWLEELDDVFGEHQILVEREKWRRCAWTVR